MLLFVRNYKSYPNGDGISRWEAFSLYFLYLNFLLPFSGGPLNPSLQWGERSWTFEKLDFRKNSSTNLIERILLFRSK